MLRALPLSVVVVEESAAVGVGQLRARLVGEDAVAAEEERESLHGGRSAKLLDREGELLQQGVDGRPGVGRANLRVFIPETGSAAHEKNNL